MKKNILSFALLSALTTTATAEGLYAVVDVGQTTAKDVCVGMPAGFSCNEKATAFKFSGGYQLTPNLGVEVGYGILGSSKISGTDTSSGFPITINADAKLTTLQVAAIGTFPLSDSFSLIGKLGVASSTVKLNGTGSGLGVTVAIPETSATSTKLAYGIGAQFDLSKNLGIRTQYENLGEVGDVNTTGTAKVSLISAGLVLKF